MAREFEFEISYAIQNGQTEMAMLWREELNQRDRDRERDASDPYRQHRERYYDELRAKVAVAIEEKNARALDDLRLRMEANQRRDQERAARQSPDPEAVPDEDAVALAEHEARAAAATKKRAISDALQEEIDRAHARRSAAWQTRKQRSAPPKVFKSTTVQWADSRKKPEPQHWRTVMETPTPSGSHESAAVAFCGREIKCFDERGDEDPHIDVNALYLQADAFELEPVSQAISAAGWAVIAKRKRAKRAKEKEA